MHIKGAIVVFMRHAGCHGKFIECDLVAEDMPHENDHMSLYAYAKALVYISKDHHCHCESIDMLTSNHVSSMHIKGAIVVFMRHAV